MSQTFENFKEFKEKYPKKAEQLLCDVEEGWYASIGVNISSTDYNGAPLLFDYIDFDALGHALASSWDDSCHYQFSDDSIITTSTGW